MESISSFFKEKKYKGEGPTPAAAYYVSSLFRTRYLHVNEVSLKI